MSWLVRTIAIAGMTDSRWLADDYFDLRQSTEALRLLRLGQTTISTGGTIMRRPRSPSAGPGWRDEAIPGHHLQFAGFIESTTLHPARIRFGINAYLEGWGRSAERLADEMGLYSSEFARVGMLAADSMRACRLVVDTGATA